MKQITGTPILAVRATLIYPVFTSRGTCITEMYKGFDTKAHKVKSVRRNGPLFVNGELVKAKRPTRTRRKAAPVITRTAERTIGVTANTRKRTAAELGITKVLIKYGE